MHKEFVGYAPDESGQPKRPPSYRGLRLRVIPAQPDHTESNTVRLLDAERRMGLKLTESFAMWPGASVCGESARTLVLRRRPP